MDQGQRDVALRVTEVPMLEPEIVRQIRGLAAMSWGSKRIATTLGISRGAARRYLRGAAPGAQERPRARRLDADQRAVAVTLLDCEAAGNAVVARQLLGERGIAVELRTLQRAVAPHRQARLAAEVATVRFETAPGHQLQIDFGERRVVIGGREMRVYFFVAVLGYLPFEKRSANLFFQLVTRRYERGSMLITTNQMVTQWGQVFGDEMIAAAVLDRLLHHSHVLVVQGESYRLKQKKRAGLVARSAG
jgi:hypothetical protein